MEGFAGFLRSIERLKDVESCIDDPRDSQDLSQLLTLHAFRPPFKLVLKISDPLVQNLCQNSKMEIQSNDLKIIRRI